MTTKELFALPTNRATVNKLSTCDSRYENVSLFSSIIESINLYLALPNSVKKITTKPTTESIYNSIMELKKYGYRKEVKELS